jgi:hypothetical protein
MVNARRVLDLVFAPIVSHWRVGLVGLLALVACAAAGTVLGRVLRPAAAPDDGEVTDNRDVPLAAPPLRLRMMNWDAGIVEPGGRRSHRVEIPNPGPDVWTMKELNSFCPCVSGQLAPTTIQPGESGWLEITFEAPRAVEASRLGRLATHLMLVFAEPGPVIQVNIQCEARASGAAHDPKKAP